MDEGMDPQTTLDECTAWLDSISGDDDRDVHVKDGIEWFTTMQHLGKQLYAEGTYAEYRDDLLAVCIRIGEETLGITWDIEAEEEGMVKPSDATGP
jgi:hypothetical protein